LNIIFTVDVEGPWNFLPSEQVKFNLEFLLHSINLLEETLKKIEDKYSQKVHVIWFLRCDDSIKKNFGSRTGLIKKLNKFIDKRLNQKDLIGFHPHFYYKDLNNNKWSSDNHVPRILDQFENSILEWKDFFGNYPLISRMGEAKMNNSISLLIDKYNIEYDFTCLPGRKRFDDHFNFNWEQSPSHMFNPSKNDYRKHSDTNKLNYIQVPFTMIEMPIKKGRINRYFNLAFHSNLLIDGIRKIKNKYLVCVVHPHEILKNKELKNHDIISRNPESILENIKNINEVFQCITFTNIYDLNK
jgi:hypothetical protein